MKIEFEDTSKDRQDFIDWIKAGLGSGDLELLLRDINDAELGTLVGGPDMLVDDDAVEDFAKILADYLVGEDE